MSSTASETVLLRGGSVVELTAVRLLWQLEERALIIRLDPDGSLRVGPRCQLTDADRAAIREHRDALVALLRAVEVM